ncbi:MAG TPA: 5'-nucleotidase C-terminal domain-containing protein [Candidatus Limnocylindrales bacterium]|nr:5'-nucleotidase C-terminal domain-containing protein [Candidatus Limnocylindrales bacterium]
MPKRPVTLAVGASCHISGGVLDVINSRSASPRARRPILGLLALIAALVVLLPQVVLAAKTAPAPVTIQILNVSDWHGNLDPVAGLGGAWNLSARWQQDRTAFPSLTLTAGDDFGATPALSSFFNEVPAVLAERMMGIQVGALGNHNFDRGVTHLQSMVNLAGAPTSASTPGSPYSYVAANLDLNGQLAGVDPYRIFEVGGVRVGVIGVTNEEAPSVVLPGAFGDIVITDSVAAANKVAKQIRMFTDVTLVITHKGVRGFTAGQPFGELIDFANALDPENVDVVFGDHTDVQYSGTHNGILVHENRSYGIGYAKTLLSVQLGNGNGSKRSEVISKSVSFVSPGPSGALSSGNTSCGVLTFCDQAIVNMLVPYRQQLAALLDGTVGTATGTFVRGGNIERRQEVPIGDLIADGMRWKYGTQLALMNGGGIRSALPSSYAPANTSLRRPVAGYACGVACPAPWDLVLGDVFTVLPFSNIITTRTVTGAQLWAALENGVSAINSVTGLGTDGRFPQISGFKFTFDYGNAVGSRVLSVALSDGTPIPNNASSTYTMALPNFVNLGGDGYTVFNDGTGTTQALDALVMKDYMAVAGPTFDPTSYPLDRIIKQP